MMLVPPSARLSPTITSWPGSPIKLTPGDYVLIALPIVGGLIAAFGGIMLFQHGKEKQGQILLASWALVAGLAAAGESLHYATQRRLMEQRG